MNNTQTTNMGGPASVSRAVRRVSGGVYRRLYRRVSGPADGAVCVCCAVSCFPSPACGCQGFHRSGDSSPGLLRSEGWWARLARLCPPKDGRSSLRCSATGQGCGPGTHANRPSNRIVRRANSASVSIGETVRTRPGRDKLAPLCVFSCWLCAVCAAVT